MKIHTAYTASHAPLAALWRASLAVEPLAEPVEHQIPMDGGNGDYGNAEWKALAEYGTRWAIETIRENIGRVVGFTDADVVFRKPFVWLAYEIFVDDDGANILFQREREDDSLFNPGVCFCRCSAELVAGMERWHAMLPAWDGHLPQQNEMMRTALHGLRIGLLPSTFATPTNGGLAGDPVLVHANNTPPPGSVAKKLVMMEKAMRIQLFYEALELAKEIHDSKKLR